MFSFPKTKKVGAFLKKSGGGDPEGDLHKETARYTEYGEITDGCYSNRKFGVVSLVIVGRFVGIL